MAASKPVIADFLEVAGRFRRSVNLERDYAGASQNGEYIVTPTAREALRRLIEGLANASSCRAWTLTGPYGVGKSAFALYLTRLLCASGESGRKALHQLEEADPQLASDLAERGLSGRRRKQMLPILVTARRTLAQRCLAEGIVEAASSVKSPYLRAPVLRIKKLLARQGNGAGLDTREVVNSLAKLAAACQDAGYRGVLLVVDELGKLFEYAARYPQKSDVFILQEIAEEAARTSGFPILVVGLLHQAFDEYAQHLDLTTRREWAKIQGRFEDIAFLEPAEQVIRMVAAAIKWTPGALPQRLKEATKELASRATQGGVIPPGMRPSDFEQVAQLAYPLHPISLVALPFVFRRFAQNERSLFSYLNSLEPYGFQEFVRQRTLDADSPAYVRLNDLFDYFTSNFGAGLYRHPHALRWLEASDVLERKERLDGRHRNIVKTIGILNALGEFCHLRASEQAVSLAITDSLNSNTELQEGLKFLQEQSIVTYRKFNDTYRIWEGSDVDIGERIAEGERKIRHNLGLADSVKRYLAPRPMVARRHSFETGALRYFEVEYADNPETVRNLQDIQTADGKILICLTESVIVEEQFRQCALNAKALGSVLFAIPQQIGELRAILTELGALRWAWENTPELRDDRVARREMSLRITDAERLLQRNLEGLLDPRNEPVGSGCVWFYKGQPTQVGSPVDVSQLLSNVCDGLYANAPRIRNELIARRSLSSAAAAARRNLIERMLTHQPEEALGIEGFPPERSMYESVLRASSLHRQDNDGKWRLLPPSRKDPQRISASWSYICEAVFKRQSEPVAVEELFRGLASPPYGVLAGLHPVLLCAFMLAYPDETTLYREGTFISEPSIMDWEVLMRRPHLFAIAGSRIAGGRALVAERLARGLKAEMATVPIVRALFRAVKGLPEYAWNTHRLPDTTLALRDAFRNARSPEQFLFVEVPEALGLLAFSEGKPRQGEVDRFFEFLNENMRLWAEATPRVVSESRDRLLDACDVEPSENGWANLRHRALTLEPFVAEPQLLTFVRRVAQAGSDAAGVESVLALVANRPPRNWSDSDVDRFPAAAAAVGFAFREAARVAGLEKSSDSQMRRLSPEDRKQADVLLHEVRDYLRHNKGEASPQVIVAAMTRLIEELQEDK